MTGARLPPQLTTFIGRDREQVDLQQLLASKRLLTLVGSGGVGKTRLALEVARIAAADYADGVALVELAGVGDATLVPRTVASRLGLQEVPSEPLGETLSRYLESRQLLLLLDNCEHVLAACAELVDLLVHTCPDLTVLATSREPLGLRGETAWRVPSLAVPESSTGGGTDEIAACDASRLFTDRAQLVVPEFVIHDRNAAAVGEICRRLDGIPLALELAAARVKVLSVDEIAARLGESMRAPGAGFDVLGSGARFGPARQQTLRATIDWSYALLDEPERQLLGRLGVFAGGWTLAAAEAVCVGAAVSADSVLEVLSRLVDKSLVFAQTGASPTRFRLLETLRQYALERLQATEEEAVVRSRHAVWCLELAETVEARLGSADEGAGLDALEREHDNVRAALTWARLHDHPLALRLAASAAALWKLRGYLVEGHSWLHELALGTSAATPARAKALLRLGEIEIRQGNNVAAERTLEASIADWRELGDAPGLAETFSQLGWAVALQGDNPRGGGLMEESISRYRQLGNDRGLGWALGRRGMLARSEGKLALSGELLDEALARLRPTGDREGIAFVLNNLGQYARVRGDYATAQRLQSESLAMFRALGAKSQVGWSLVCMFDVALHQGRLDDAQRLIEEGLVLLDSIGGQRHLAMALSSAGIVAIRRGHHARGVRLIAAASAYEAILASMDADEINMMNTSLSQAREDLGEAEFDSCWSEGGGLGQHQAVRYALSPEPPQPRPVADLAAPLTTREREVAALLARGCSNREIAEELVIAERTAEAHVTHVLTKLGLRSRSQVVVWAVEHGLTGG